jgi:AraC-like DNA-binding protein
MELLNKEEHLGCYVYDNQGEPLINYMKLVKNEILHLSFSANKIMFLVKGKLTYSYSNVLNKVFDESTFQLFPAGYNVTIKAEENSKLLFVNIYSRVNFCNHFPLELLYKLNQGIKSNTHNCSLKLNSILADYIDLLIQTMEDGLKCSYFHELKQKELLFYLRAYYPKEDLLDFFMPILSSDVSFSEFIYQNIDKIKSVENIAELSNYSISGFKKRFAKVFGMPPYQ